MLIPQWVAKWCFVEISTLVSTWPADEIIRETKTATQDKPEQLPVVCSCDAVSSTLVTAFKVGYVSVLILWWDIFGWPEDTIDDVLMFYSNIGDSTKMVNGRHLLEGNDTLVTGCNHILCDIRIMKDVIIAKIQNDHQRQIIPECLSFSKFRYIYKNKFYYSIISIVRKKIIISGFYCHKTNMRWLVPDFIYKYSSKSHISSHLQKVPHSSVHEYDMFKP